MTHSDIEPQSACAFLKVNVVDWHSATAIGLHKIRTG